MIHRCYAWWPELKGCQTQGKTVEETLTDIREAIELFLETLTDEERSEALRHEILTTAVDVQRRFVRGSDMSWRTRADLEVCPTSNRARANMAGCFMTSGYGFSSVAKSRSLTPT
jgi:predicted RNase H-like HicB family nuclease